MLNKLLTESRTVAIGGHIRPDGDCVGSCMGLYQYIRNNFSEVCVDVYLETIPDKFELLQGTEDIKHEIPEGKEYDLFICLDCGDMKRLGFSAPLFESAKHTFCIDHHVSNQSFADDNYIVPDASSASELVYDVIDKDKITDNLAQALYMGIVHDTGVFQYSCASPKTFRVAAKLLEYDFDAPALIDSTYYEKTFAQNKILGYALMNSELLLDGLAITAHIDEEQMNEFGVNPKDFDGIVSQLRITAGVDVAIFGYELQENQYKLSLRSKKMIDVNKVAGALGGGGHVRAAGCTVCGTFDEILERVLNEISKQI